MVRHFVIAFERWGSRRSSLRRVHRGRTPTLSVSSVRSAETAWITSSSSTKATYAASYRAIFNTITTLERISRFARTARGLVPYNLPPPVKSLPSRKLAVCTIAMSAEPPEGKSGPSCSHPAQHVNFEQGQANQPNSRRIVVRPEANAPDAGQRTARKIEDRHFCDGRHIARNAKVQTCPH